MDTRRRRPGHARHRQRGRCRIWTRNPAAETPRRSHLHRDRRRYGCGQPALCRTDRPRPCAGHRDTFHGAPGCPAQPRRRDARRGRGLAGRRLGQPPNRGRQRGVVQRQRPDADRDGRGRVGAVGHGAFWPSRTFAWTSSPRSWRATVPASCDATRPWPTFASPALSSSTIPRPCCSTSSTCCRWTWFTGRGTGQPWFPGRNPPEARPVSPRCKKNFRPVSLFEGVACLLL